jgi:putative nucleotidyltransferase with HDIG domain
VAPAAPFVPSKLPVLPLAASRLLQTSDESASVTQLELIAGSDPALAAQLLSAANSAFYGSRCRIHRLRDALMRLGVPTGRKVLMAASFSAVFATKHLQALWTHSQEVAAAAYELAALCGADADSAFVAGLLHDLGRVAFTVFPEPMQSAERSWLAAGFPLIYAETMAYGSDHASFGAELLRSWRLPEEIAAAVAHHHRPECSESRLHAAVHLAESDDEDLWSNMRKKAALDRTGIGREQLDSILLGRLAAV